MLKESNNDVFYVFTAKPSPWPNELSPPDVDESAFAFDNEIFHNIIAGKRVTDNDTVPMVPRINWQPGVVYDPYNARVITDTANLQFYVLTNDRKVFKCINNNKGVGSTIEPYLESRRTFKTSDGYEWRYLYTISEADFAKFATSRYIPITPNTTITSFAVPGTIDYIAVANGGSEYYAYHSGNTSAVIDNSNFVIGSSASANDGFYVNSAIYFMGDLLGATSKIVNYDASTKTVSIDPPVPIRAELILANNGAGEFTTNLTARQEYFEAVVFNTVGTSVTPSLTIVQRGPSGANQNYVVIDTFDGGMRIHRTNPTHIISTTEPWRATSGESVKTGSATTAAGSNAVSGTAGTLFTTEYVPGDFIRVGNEVRQIATIPGASSLTTTQTWASTWTANVHIKPARAGFFSTITHKTATGTINSVDISAAVIYLSSISGTFLNGETVSQANSSGTIATGLVIDANSSSLYIGNVVGTFTYTANLQVLGSQSNAVATPRSNNGIVSTPRLLITNSVGSWYSANISALTSSNTEVANAKIAAVASFPGIGTPYLISPRVVIDGDGEGATAYSVVNTVNYSIDSIIITDPGRDYTYANVYLEANSLYGNSGSISAYLSPVAGVGANVQNELNSRYTGISIQFSNSSLEGQYFSTNGTFRQIGLMKNPKFRDVTLNVGELSRWTANIVTVTPNNFVVGETVFQTKSGTDTVAAFVTYANSTYIELDRKSANLFTSNTANDSITGLTSSAVANVKSINVNSFPVNTAITQTIYQESSEANAVLVAANSTVMLVTNAVGLFTNSSAITDDDKYRGSFGRVYDKTSNSYATITNVGVARKLTNFTFDKFNQIHRVPVDSISGTFIVNERVSQDDVEGYIYNTNTDVDLVISGTAGSILVGEVITQNTTGATGVVTTSNSTYLRLGSANGVFLPTYQVVTPSGNATATAVYSVLNLYGTDADFGLTSSPIIGEVSNAQATTVSNRALTPDLVRNSGEVLYIQNSTAVIKSPTSQEQIKIVVQVL